MTESIGSSEPVLGVDPAMYDVFHLGRWGSAWRLVVEAGVVTGAPSRLQWPVVHLWCKPFRVTAGSATVRHADREVVLIDLADPGSPIRFQAPRRVVAGLVDSLRRAGFHIEGGSPRAIEAS